MRVAEVRAFAVDASAPTPTARGVVVLLSTFAAMRDIFLLQPALVYGVSISPTVFTLHGFGHSRFYL